MGTKYMVSCMIFTYSVFMAVYFVEFVVFGIFINKWQMYLPVIPQ